MAFFKRLSRIKALYLTGIPPTRCTYVCKRRLLQQQHQQQQHKDKHIKITNNHTDHTDNVARQSFPFMVNGIAYPKYNYNYGVADSHTGDVKSQHEFKAKHTKLIDNHYHHIV
uniref:Uncharacterized protein n=1 Tax=Glossina brevipalpis TaxID=37001 RepID=A0A1A9WCY5_9MUSC